MKRSRISKSAFEGLLDLQKADVARALKDKVGPIKTKRLQKEQSEHEQTVTSELVVCTGEDHLPYGLEQMAQLSFSQRVIPPRNIESYKPGKTTIPVFFLNYSANRITDHFAQASPIQLTRTFNQVIGSTRILIAYAYLPDQVDPAVAAQCQRLPRLDVHDQLTTYVPARHPFDSANDCAAVIEKIFDGKPGFAVGAQPRSMSYDEKPLFYVLPYRPQSGPKL